MFHSILGSQKGYDPQIEDGIDVDFQRVFGTPTPPFPFEAPLSSSRETSNNSSVKEGAESPNRYEKNEPTSFQSFPSDKSFPVAQRFCQPVIHAFNSHDPIYFRDLLGQLCTPLVRIRIKSFNTSEPTYGFKELDFSLEEFSVFYSNWIHLIPDCILQPTSFRSCLNSPPTYVFISSFHLSGFLLCSEVNPIETRLDRLSPDFVEEVLNKSCSNLPKRNISFIQLPGSLVTYVNTKGYIECIEFFYDQTDDKLNENSEEENPDDDTTSK